MTQRKLNPIRYDSNNTIRMDERQHKTILLWISTYIQWQCFVSLNLLQHTSKCLHVKNQNT